MQPITFTNGSRVYTSQNPQSPPPQLVDLNGDGEIDILDAAEATSLNLNDFNQDGIIDEIDIAILLSGEGPGGVIVDPPPPPTPPADPVWPDPYIIPTPEDTKINPVYCETVDTSEPRFTFSNGSNFNNSGIITTGCNSIYTVDGDVNWPDWPAEDPLFCPEGKARGWEFDAEAGTVRYTDECKCTEANSAVHAGSLFLALFGGGKTETGKKVAKTIVTKTLSAAEQALESALKYKKFLDDMLESTIRAMTSSAKLAAENKRKLDLIRQAMQTGVHPITGKQIPPEIANKLADAAKTLEQAVYRYEREVLGDNISIGKIKDKIAAYDALIAQYRDAVEKSKGLIGDLDHFNPENWINGLLMALIPLGQFLVPKYCASNQELDENCNCVNKPIVSGSYSYSSLNSLSAKALGYNTIESL